MYLLKHLMSPMGGDISCDIALVDVVGSPDLDDVMSP